MKKKMRKMDFGIEVLKGLRELRDATVRGDYSRLTVREVSSPDPPRLFKARDVKALRSDLAMSQAVFAHLVAVSPVLVRAWEQGHRKPSPLACRLLEEVAARPDYWRSKVQA
ncbi:MAG: transcriptional regulator [Phycisphaerae bacterium]